MINKVIQFIDKYNLRNKTIIVGFSGGFDSMCLLDILTKIREECNLNIIAAHYNHNWRGEKAKSEQLACENFCLSKNIDFYTETADADVKKNETAARELRYQFFERAFHKYNADAVFTAHNYNDNAETILYRIIKGTGIVGLKGVLQNRNIYFRPLLNVNRDDIERYCMENDLKPNIDDSNSDNIHKRNLIRNEILPLLKQINPEVIASLNNLGQIAQLELNIIDEYIQEINKSVFDKEKIKTAKFKELSDSMKQKIIYNLIYNSKIDYTKESIENILNFIDDTIKSNKPSKYSLGKDCWLYTDKNIIEIMSSTEKNNEIIKINEIGEYKFNEHKFIIEKTKQFKKLPDETEAIIDLSNINTNKLVIRTRRDGDIMQPLGTQGKMKLKKYLMAKNIPAHKRDSLILLAYEKEVLWVAGVGLSDKIKTVDVPTHHIKIKKIRTNNENNK